MASASSSSARLLFSDSKRRLAERVNVNVNNAASVARQIVRGSKSNEVCNWSKIKPCIESIGIWVNVLNRNQVTLSIITLLFTHQPQDF